MHWIKSPTIVLAATEALWLPACKIPSDAPCQDAQSPTSWWVVHLPPAQRHPHTDTQLLLQDPLVPSQQGSLHPISDTAWAWAGWNKSQPTGELGTEVLKVYEIQDFIWLHDIIHLHPPSAATFTAFFSGSLLLVNVTSFESSDFPPSAFLYRSPSSTFSQAK